MKINQTFIKCRWELKAKSGFDGVTKGKIYTVYKMVDNMIEWTDPMPNFLYLDDNDKWHFCTDSSNAINSFDWDGSNKKKESNLIIMNFQVGFDYGKVKNDKIKKEELKSNKELLGV